MNKFIPIIFGIKTLVLSLLITGCNKPDEFPTTPVITYNRVELFNSDSLVLTFDFTDGDGDLGLFGSENYPPYHDFEVISGSDDKFVTFSSIDNLLPLKGVLPNQIKSTRQPINWIDYEEGDDRPANFDCYSYLIGYLNPERTFFTSEDSILSGGQVSVFYTTEISNSNSIFIDEFALIKDTVFIHENERRNNIYIEFYRDPGNGDYELFDIRSFGNLPGCGELDFNARFPVLDENSFGSSLEGTISYSMLSSGFNLFFKTGNIKLRFWVLDRNGNVSNVVETPDFTLSGISRD